MDRIQVENDLFLVRETASGAVLNTDRMAYETFKANKANKKQSEDSLRSEIETLKALVNQLLGQNNGNS